MTHPVPTTLMIVSGEPSGDRLGAALMKALKKRRPGLRFIGVGGPAMKAEGLTSAFPMEELAMMGLVEVIPAIPRVLRRLKELTTLAETEHPAALITIDSQDFSARLAKKVAKLGVPRIQYVAPKVWAWRQGRVHKLKRIFTDLLTILPFETPFFKAAGWPATYVGHPAVAAMAKLPANSMTTPLTLALLPGSRYGEIARHWPLMLATYRALKKEMPALTGEVILTDKRLLARCRALAPWGETEGLSVVLGDSRFDALSRCRAALTKSGTNNLEAALLGIPAVVCYRMNALTWQVAKRLVKVKHVSLPNLILGQPVYPEFLQDNATPQALAKALRPLLQQKDAFARQKAQLARLRTAMATPKPAAEMAAEAVLTILDRNAG